MSLCTLKITDNSLVKSVHKPLMLPVICFHSKARCKSDVFIVNKAGTTQKVLAGLFLWPSRCERAVHLAFEPGHEIMVLFVLVNSFFKHACAAIQMARCLIFCRTLRLLPYIRCANCEGSGETAQTCMLA